VATGKAAPGQGTQGTQGTGTGTGTGYGTGTGRFPDRTTKAPPNGGGRTAGLAHK